MLKTIFAKHTIFRCFRSLEMALKKLEKNDTVGEIQDFGEWVFVYYRNTYPDFTYGYVRKSELKKNIRHPFENIDLFY